MVKVCCWSNLTVAPSQSKFEKILEGFLVSYDIVFVYCRSKVVVEGSCEVPGGRSRSARSTS